MFIKMNFLIYIIDNFDLIKSVSLMYIIPQIVYYGYMYNLSEKKHIQENKQMLQMIKDIHNKIISTSQT